MPDISMCKNKECIRKISCYRYMARPNLPWQSYGEFKPVNNSESEFSCDYFWQLKTLQNIGSTLFFKNDY